MSDLDLSSHPDLVGHLADWTPASHTITIADAEVLLTVLLTRKVEAPDYPEGV